MIRFASPQSHPIRPCKGRAGFSLVEVMVAATVLVIIGGTAFMALGRLHRNAAENRNYACAQIVLRNAIDQALTRGWNDAASPSGILAPTIAGSGGAYDSSTGGWTQWNPYSASDDSGPGALVPVYSDQMDPARNISGMLFRKVQYVTGTDSLLWVTLRLDYTYDSKACSNQMATVRALD